MKEPNGKAPAKSRPASVFIAYSHKDSELCRKLRTHLKSLELDGKIEILYDGIIEVGEKWDSKLQSVIRSADIVVFLLSAEFFDSDYIMREELPAAMRRRNLGESFVIPVFARHCRPTEVLKDLECVGSPEQPIESETPPDKGWARVAGEIERKADLIGMLKRSAGTGVTLHLLRRLNERLPLATQRARSVWLCSRTGMGWDRNYHGLIRGLSQDKAVRLLFLNPESVAFDLDSQMQWTSAWGAKGAQDPHERREAARDFCTSLVKAGMNVRVTDALLPMAFWIFNPNEPSTDPTAILEIVRWRADQDGNVYWEQNGGDFVMTYQTIFEGVWERARPWDVAGTGCGSVPGNEGSRQYPPRNDRT